MNYNNGIRAERDRGTVVEGEVWLARGRLEQGPGATVAGAVHRGLASFGWSWLAATCGCKIW